MRIITISREFGSGGRTVGKQVAESLGIRYYDKELVKEVAAQTGFQESFVEEHGEHAPAKNWLSYVLALNGQSSSGMSANDLIWAVQRQVILEIAEEGPCVIVGRCADYVHTGRDWGMAQNYHISLDSGVIGIEKCGEIISDLYRC